MQHYLGTFWHLETEFSSDLEPCGWSGVIIISDVATCRQKSHLEGTIEGLKLQLKKAAEQNRLDKSRSQQVGPVTRINTCLRAYCQSSWGSAWVGVGGITAQLVGSI